MFVKLFVSIHFQTENQNSCVFILKASKSKFFNVCNKMLNANKDLFIGTVL